MGVPVITSSTPAYERAMQRAGLKMTCNDNNDWFNLLNKYITSQEDREYSAIAGKRVADENYSEETVLRNWDKVFDSIF